MSDDSAELHVKVRHRNRPPKPYKWEIYRENDPVCIKRAMHGYRTQQAAANAGEKALRRFLESEALKQEQGIMADKHSKPPETPNDNAKSIDRWDDEGGAPSGGRSVRKRPRGCPCRKLTHGEASRRAGCRKSARPVRAQNRHRQREADSLDGTRDRRVLFQR